MNNMRTREEQNAYIEKLGADYKTAAALCVVTLADIVPFQRKHLEAAYMEPGNFRSGMFAWILENVRPIVPVKVKGKLSLWEYTEPIEYIKPAKTDEEDKAQFEKYWKPLMV